LPLWNGPTSAMHLGPLGLVPFCPITASLRLNDYAFIDRVALNGSIVSGDRGDWQAFRVSHRSRVVSPEAEHISSF
jgi:hypothetical protein